METPKDILISAREYDLLDKESQAKYYFPGIDDGKNNGLYKLKPHYRLKQEEQILSNAMQAIAAKMNAKKPEGIEATLAERGGRYGEFTDHAAICQALKGVVYGRAGWDRLQADAKQSVEVIFDKIARMVNGDPEYDDNWRDIVGYATLVLNRILADKEKQPELSLAPAEKPLNVDWDG